MLLTPLSKGFFILNLLLTLVVSDVLRLLIIPVKFLDFRVAFKDARHKSELIALRPGGDYSIMTTCVPKLLQWLRSPNNTQKQRLWHMFRIFIENFLESLFISE